MPIIDGSSIKDLPPIPAGIYGASFEEFELKDGPKGSYYSMTFAVKDDDTDFDGRKVFRNISLSAQSLWAFKRAALSLGASEEEFEGELDTDELLEGLLHNACRVKVSVGEYEGRPNNSVDQILAPAFE
jgi:hypothetical protein